MKKLFLGLSVIVLILSALIFFWSAAGRKGKTDGAHVKPAKVNEAKPSPDYQNQKLAIASATLSESQHSPGLLPLDAASASGSSASMGVVPLTGSQVSVETKDGIRPLSGSEGLFDRVMIEEHAKISLLVNLRSLKTGQKVLISAPNGGNLNREDQGALSFSAAEASEQVKLSFVSSLGRGAYTVRIQHEGESQIIDLWAGERLPLGERGPDYVANEFSDEVP